MSTELAAPKKRKKRIPPKLVYPAPRPLNQSESQKALKALVQRGLPIRYVEGMDWQALAVNVVTGLAIFTLMYLGLHLMTHNPRITVAIPLLVIWVLVVIFSSRLGTAVKGREASVYLDNLSRELIVYLKGFHFVAWYSSKEADILSFQKHEVRKAAENENTALTLTTQDGYEVLASLVLMFSLRNNLDALSKSLKYYWLDLQDWLWAITVGSLSDLAACNSYESLLYWKADAAVWLSGLYGGEGFISLIEDETGTEVKNPILTALNPTKKSRELFEIRARTAAIAQGFETLIDAGMSPGEAEIVAQTSAGAAVREIRTYQGLPTGTKIIALGDSGMAVAHKN